MILAERAARVEAEIKLVDARAEAANAQADLSNTEALISRLKLEIEKLRRELYGSRSERKARLLAQMELQLEDLEAAATEDELAAETAAARTGTVKSFERKRPSRKPFPEHLPRERVVITTPENCPCCGSSKLSKLGEDVTETLEVIPRQWKVIQTVRERLSCRQCETITQPPAPFHVTPRGFAGPNLLATILFEKFGQHQPLNRQSERYRREGIDLSLSTLADQVGACTTVLQPLHALIEAHVLAAERLHGDDTTVPILAKGKTVKGHIWTYVRDDRPFGGPAPPAALYYASRDRRHEHPVRHLRDFAGILQADAYDGYNELYAPSRLPGPVTSALCWAHARRQFFELADIAANARRGRNAAAISPIALEAVRRIDVLFDIERGINGLSAEERLRVRHEQSAPLVTALEAWLREERARLSHSASVTEPIDYMLKRWDRFARFIDDGRICLTNNAAERALRGFALGRKSWLFAGSERGADRAAVMATLIMTAKLNDIDPLAWLADVLARIAGIPQGRLHELLPWEWKCAASHPAAAQAA
ncbi:IS66 family transposase [Bradyrhizobium cenepequi]|uniref:IS66 family transposase n=1 Tax=Bradyrhizobium cenepequi TaxID=2821403 RepID=UPI001CE2858A|nr:IS66 family transposase [Bradyrhizobium cenepequi]MCA6113219.1 IS66 family transposase [Bradyrhizobium cenepequi]